MPYDSWTEALGNQFREVYQAAVEYVPQVVVAVTLIGLGWLIAWLLRRVTVRFLARLNRMLPNRAKTASTVNEGVEGLASRVISGVVFWGVLLFFVAAATAELGLPVITDAITSLARYLPRVLGAAVIIFTGLVLGSLARTATISAADRAGFDYAKVLGQVSKMAVLLLTVVIALEQLGVDSNLLMLGLIIVLGSFIGGGALAFGLGARTAASNVIASHYLNETYEVGQRIRVSDIEGRIVEIKSTGVVIDTSEGRVFVPAKEFSESISILLNE
ncbi:MAG TPA: mechanosensitive ion channel domain-containing protein [Vicinamibacteria bacterium]|jgi:small-conductance mechanosensitive channel